MATLAKVMPTIESTASGSRSGGRRSVRWQGLLAGAGLDLGSEDFGDVGLVLVPEGVGRPYSPISPPFHMAFGGDHEGVLAGVVLLVFDGELDQVIQVELVLGMRQRELVTYAV